MKNMRKIACVLLALVMVFALAAPVFAAETYSITINNTATGHTYEAYQIFKGDLSGSTLSNVQWGASVTSHTGDATAIVEKLDTAYTGDDKLTVDGLLAMITLGEEVAATSTQTNGKYVIDGLAPGYYLVKDAYGSLNGANDAYTQYIVKVVKDVEAEPKSSVPQIEKKVKDINDSTDANYSAWQDSADHDIGDDVPFQLTATLANNVEAYNTYKIVFHDTMSKGLTFEKITKVTVDGKEITAGYVVDTVVNADGTTSLTITFANVKAQGGTDSSKVVVEYTATLNENANIGATGNPNVVYLEYSNNPNWDADGDGKPDEPGTPGTPGEPGGEEPEEPTGKTPEDKVIVFTFKVVVNKVDENNAALAGAGFTLFKLDNKTGDYVQIGDELTGDQMTQFVWKGLDDGNYKLVETTTPAGYNTIAPIEFTISAEHNLTWESEAQTAILTKLEGGDMFTGEVSTGALTGNVINKSGVELPETGGIGTTIFYTMGGMLALGAAILLITKKRMGAAE